MKCFLITILLLLSFGCFAQPSVIADPATGAMSFRDLNGSPLNPLLLRINEPVYLRVPISNLNSFNSVPDGSIKIKVGLGSKMRLDPSFDISTAALSNYFVWTSSINNGQVEILGDLIFPLEPGFADTAVFMVLPHTLMNSSVTTNVLISNHNTGTVVSDENPTNNTSNRTYTVIRHDQTITFANLNDVTYGDPNFTLNATASSGLTVSYTCADPAVCTISGNTVIIQGAGSTQIIASQPGNGMYNPAPDVTQAFTVLTKELTLSGVVSEDKVFDSTNSGATDISAFVLNGLVGTDAPGIMGNAEFLDPWAGINKPMLTFFELTGPRAYNYTLVQPTITGNILKAPQLIAFDPLPPRILSDPPFNLVATAESGLPVSFSSSDPLVATVSGDVVTLIGVGTTIITASQAGDDNYLPADPVAQNQDVLLTITVNIKLFLQGYYLGAGVMQPVLMNQGVSTDPLETDTITIELYDASLQLMGAQQAILYTDGSASAEYPLPSGDYFIAIRHRNSIYTWSAAPVSCNGNSALYDFSGDITNAFGNNQILMEPGVYAVYSGDLNQDEFIDGNDFPQYDADSFNGVSGVYVATDINGDGFVDGNDFPVLDMNSFNGVSSMHP